MDVVGIERLQRSQVTIATGRDLPKTGHSRYDTRPQSLEGRSESVQMVFGQWTWSDESHLSQNDIEDLRKLVETRASQEAAHARKDPRIIAQLAALIPFLSSVRVL